MSIIFNRESQTLTLHTKETSYQIKMNEFGILIHTYYGPKINGDDMSYLVRTGDVGFSAALSDAKNDRCSSLDLWPQEYSFSNMGDFRDDCLEIEYENGSSYSDFRYESHKIYQGKYALEGLPAMFATRNETTGEAQEESCGTDDVTTLEVVLKSKINDQILTLYYGVFEEYDVITRAAKLENNSQESIILKKALSVCLDHPDLEMDLITLTGRHAMEREVNRQAVSHGIHVLESRRGTSSHQYNPFLILCDKHTTEEEGSCFGSCLVYSGSFEARVEGTQMGQIRMTMGIQSAGLRYLVKSGESFTMPEVILGYSAHGLGQLSRQFHKAMQHHLCRSKFALQRRPILINNWEATYFTFTGEKLIQIAEESAQLGIELFVMDDGWFGKREDDNSGLGDWVVNEKKLGMTLGELASRINQAGMQFGIWFEPEMVSEDSNLYRAHPEWAMTIPGKEPNRSRNQLVLDLTREDVRTYLFDTLCAILDSANISYVKWDMNRSLADVYSRELPSDRQGELQHRYVLGLYDLLNKFTTRYPDILFEGCSGGGGRFDAGMLYYHPQIWCSDNTESIDRLKIQYGTSLAYPISSMGSHVSAVPNHQNGRSTSLQTRGIVAMAGTFGYELDVNKMTAEEKEIVKKQVTEFADYYEMIQFGDYYRLSSPYTDEFTAWQFISKDRKRVLVNVVATESKANSFVYIVRLKGVDPHANYLDGKGKVYSGSALLYGGYPLPPVTSPYQGFQLLFEQVK